jgi:hypothetical protein
MYLELALPLGKVRETYVVVVLQAKKGRGKGAETQSTMHHQTVAVPELDLLDWIKAKLQKRWWCNGRCREDL